MSRRMQTRATVIVAVCGAASSAILTTAPAASAATPAAETHCVQAATPIGGAAQPAVCFSRFDDAIAYATGGKVRLANASGSRAVTSAELSGLSPLTSSPISIMYADASYGGSSYTWTGTACTSTHGYADPGMPSGWNDRVGSMHVYQNCDNTLYADSSYGGASISSGRNGDESSLGSLNDKGSSETWAY